MSHWKEIHFPYIIPSHSIPSYCMRLSPASKIIERPPKWRVTERLGTSVQIGTNTLLYYTCDVCKAKRSSCSPTGNSYLLEVELGVSQDPTAGLEKVLKEKAFPWKPLGDMEREHS